ncbi:MULTISPECIES: N-acetyltransferase [Arcobacteraceae]|uniref:Acetyltransferase, GNAT Family n=7 Tax=root TaxID=1 RepID=A8ETG8_ALIB4|nr:MULTISPECIES: N-acetyltransferase [Arcobacteraceae]MCP3649094.1 N-acetyltransferase [Arcobacter sp. DNRA7]ABV67242.1 acetyltransferase, GNAT Family [Aliarcobacter butzleri RM4018]AGR77289.1 acetyltransferase, GNAT Family [Aliarcobacter butzleri 7h1h]EFU69482.1 GNAT family acetyltransferase [Aliarcobacter butzleri JV22]KLD97874.1 acetyltransferase [Aliarcobacter butzleri L349]
MEIRFYKPTVADIKAMQELVKEEVEKGKILLRTEDEMATTIRSYTIVEVDGQMAGFTATHIHSPRLAEVRSLVVGEKFRGLKLGKKLVEACINEAKEYGIKQVLSLTYEKGFFESCGFREIAKEDIPEQKIWADCIRCKLFPICNEIAMVIDI